MNEEYPMNKISAVLCAVVGFLLMALSSVPAFSVEHNLLLIHGRFSPCPGPPNGDYIPGSCSNPEVYGTWAHDQINYWGLTPKHPLITGAHVHFVQWDAWERHFYQHGAPGGFSVIQQATHAYCDASKGQYCYVICHSAGCAALENYIATSGEVGTRIQIVRVIAAASAAGGSEVAQQGCDSGISLAIAANNIDCSLRMADARNAYNHNQMHGVSILGIAGTTNTTWTACSAVVGFPGQTGPVLNPNCSLCYFAGAVPGRRCSDEEVALHSSCGHSRAGTFQDCNSTIHPYNDTAGTYDFHSWWGQSVGPFSTPGMADYKSKFRTYSVNHGGARALAIDEYSKCPPALCP
jgi:hypothetical protein